MKILAIFSIFLLCTSCASDVDFRRDREALYMQWFTCLDSHPEVAHPVAVCSF